MAGLTTEAVLTGGFMPPLGWDRLRGSKTQSMAPAPIWRALLIAYFVAFNSFSLCSRVRLIATGV
jgi:hypothetical protein